MEEEGLIEFDVPLGFLPTVFPPGSGERERATGFSDGALMGTGEESEGAVVAIPFLMDQYTNILWLGSIITFLTVTCLVGLHEVAREMENPFRNVPNEIPLCLVQVPGRGRVGTS